MTEEERNNLEKRDNIAKKSMVLGAGSTALGGGYFAANKYLDKKVKGLTKKEQEELARYLRKANVDSALAKKSAKNVMALGTLATGLSAYKHYKYKKQLKDDSTEK